MRYGTSRDHDKATLAVVYAAVCYGAALTELEQAESLKRMIDEILGWACRLRSKGVLRRFPSCTADSSAPAYLIITALPWSGLCDPRTILLSHLTPPTVGAYSWSREQRTGRWMDHAEALRIGAVDRYLLRELSETEQNNFEEHFFCCPECAAEVKLAATFAANVRALLLEAQLEDDPGVQTGPAFRQIHRYLTVAGGEVCGAFSNAELAMETAKLEAQRLNVERRRMGRWIPTSFYVRDRRTGQRITEADLEAQGDRL